jgi:large repetitive protein
MKCPSLSKWLSLAALALSVNTNTAKAQAITENFDNITTLTGSGWFMQNNSSPVGTTGWFQGNTGVFTSYNGATNAYIGANYNNTGNTGTISNWLLTPVRVLKNGDVITFRTRQAASTYADRLQVKMSTNGTSTNCGTGAGLNAVGDFTTQVIEINAAQTGAGYPETWTLYSYTVSGLSNSALGRFAFRYYVTSAGLSGTASDYIGIDNFTYTPNCASLAISPSTFTAGTVGISYNQTLTLTNGYGSPTYAVTTGSLPPGLTLSSGGVLSGTPTTAGSYTFSITATDGNPGTCTATTSYTLVISCPTITVAPSTLNSGTAGVAYSQNITQSGSNGTTITYTVSTGSLPTGMTLSSGGLLSGTPTVTGTFNFTVSATDNYGCVGTRSYSLFINCPTITLTPGLLPNATATQGYIQNISNTGSVGTTNYAITAGALPAGLTLASNGDISGTPTVTGIFGFQVTATDANGCTGSLNYTLNVDCQTVAIDQATLPNGTATVAYNETLTQTGGYGTPNFTITSGSLPTGLTLASNGTISGTPTATGIFNFDVTMADANGCSAVQSLSITIDCQTITIDQATLPNVVINTSYNETLTNTGSYGTSSYAVTAGSLPAGITMNSSGNITGTPTATGTSTFDVTVTDANGCTGVQTLSITVVCQPIAIDQASVPAGTAGVAYSETLTQTGGAGTGSYAVTTGSLPAGITLSTAGVLGGTPTVTGTFNIDITFTDDNGCTAVQAYALIINCQSLSIDQATLPDGVAGVTYGQTVTQTGGIGTASFAISSGALPAGLTLDASGTFQGAPTVTGTFSFEVTATDGNGCTSTAQSYTIDINCPNISIDQSTLPDAFYNTVYSANLTNTGGVGAASYAITGGSLPAGLTMASDGTISGTCAVGPGIYTIDVQCTDGNGCTSTTQTITLYTNWPLAISLEQFTAVEENGNALVQWKVAHLDGNERFEVQRSTDGKQFETIASVQADKNKSSYSVTDRQMKAGSNYYRLRSTEMNDEISYSHVIRLNKAGDEIVQDVKLLPNIVNNRAVLQVTATQDGSCMLRITDMAGREMQVSKHALKQGANAIDMDMSGLPAGSYTIGVRTNGAVVPVKFVKM